MKPPVQRDAAWRRAADNRIALGVASGAAGMLAVSVYALAGGPKATPDVPSQTKTAVPQAAKVAPRSQPNGGSDEETGAVAYYREKDPSGKVAGHVDEVRWSGRYLRVYTDLKESDTHSKVAFQLCQWTGEYLTDRRGSKNPVVFVHAKKNDNGNVVLVSKLSAKAPCKSVETL
ncbi:MAG TPA: hypothetical protein VH912_05415 [Streptosporangiaceae bacterium]